VDGAQVPSVELEPATVTVEIDVRTVETSKTVAVRPQVTGSVAPGFEIASLTSAPSVVTLFGMPDELALVNQVSTEPLSIGGLTESTSIEAQLDLPEGTRLAGGDESVTVNIEVQAAIATRTLLLGLVCQGADDGVACLPRLDQVSAVLRGPAAVLADLEPADLLVELDVAGLDPGDHEVEPTLNPPNGINVVSISPGVVALTLQEPEAPPDGN
jgi:YbbR domain-containing protein